MESGLQRLTVLLKCIEVVMAKRTARHNAHTKQTKKHIGAKELFFFLWKCIEVVITARTRNAVTG